MAHPGGRPPKYNKEFHPKEYVRLSAQGECKASCCAAFGISAETLAAWGRTHTEFSEALKTGLALREAWWARLGLAAMSGQAKINGEEVKINPTLFIWLSKNIVGWRDKIDVKEQDDDEYEFKTK